MGLRIGIIKWDDQEFIPTGTHSVFSKSALQEMTLLYVDEQLVVTTVRSVVVMSFLSSRVCLCARLLSWAL